MNLAERFRSLLEHWVPLTGRNELKRLRSKVAALEVENNCWKTICRDRGAELNRRTTENEKLTARLKRQKEKLTEILNDYQTGLNAIKASLETTEPDSCTREVTREQGRKQNQGPQPPDSQAPHQGKPAAVSPEKPTHREKQTWPLKKS